MCFSRRGQKKGQGRNHHPLFTRLRNEDLRGVKYRRPPSLVTLTRTQLSSDQTLTHRLTFMSQGSVWVGDMHVHVASREATLQSWSKEEQLAHQTHALSDYLDSGIWWGWLLRCKHVAAHVNVDGVVGFCELCWSGNALIVQWRCRRSSDQRSWHIGPTVLQREKQFRHVCFTQWREREQFYTE